MCIGKLKSTLNEANSMSSCYRVPSEEARAEITTNNNRLKRKQFQTHTIVTNLYLFSIKIALQD
jgi:hypothetical protein